MRKFHKCCRIADLIWSVLFLGLIIFTTLGCSQPTTQPPEKLFSFLEEQKESPPIIPELSQSRECVTGRQPSGATYQLCLPEFWNGDLVIYAPGFVNPQSEITLPEVQVEGRTIAEIFTGLNYAYTTTSYRAPGLILPEAIDDIVELAALFEKTYISPGRIFLIGESEGGLVVALAIENNPNLFDGGLAICSPVGSFREQINYTGDFHLLFSYFFHKPLNELGIDLGSPTGVPVETCKHWESQYKPLIQNLLLQHPKIVSKLLHVAKVSNASEEQSRSIQIAIELLESAILGTNDGINRLGGIPFDNSGRRYSGTGSLISDWRLNKRIQRISADRSAIREIKAHYQPTGQFKSHLVTLHTIDDHMVKYFHEILFRLRAFDQGSIKYHCNIPLYRSGHGDLQQYELLAGFGVLIYRATHQNVFIPESTLESTQALLRLADNYDVTPEMVSSQTPESRENLGSHLEEESQHHHDPN